MLNRALKWCYKFAFAFWDVEFTVRLKRHQLRRHIVRAGLVVIPFAAIYYGIINFINAPPHDFSASDCFGCHFTIPQDGDPRPYRFVEPIDNLCRRCHVKINMVSHSENIAPAITTPADFSLDESGRLTCATCHDPHMDPVNPNTGGRSYFLRGWVTGKVECALCHTSELSVIHLQTHRPGMDRAHGFSSYTVIYPGTGQDSLSIMCTDCHDAPGTPQKTYPGAGIWKDGPDIGQSHPIGIDYNEVAQVNKKFRPMIDLDPRLLFFEGRIGCCTCHDPYQPGGGVGLRIGVKGSFQNLCLACHIK
jgi:hypothetical protein